MTVYSTLQTPIATKLVNDDGTINHVWNEFFVRLMKNAGVTVSIADLETSVADLETEIDSIETETSSSITMTDSDSNLAATLAVLYDGNKSSDGIEYIVSGNSDVTDSWIQYKYGVTDYIDRVAVYTADANGRVYIGYSVDGTSWSFLQAEADHTLTSEGKLETATSQGNARTNYLQLVSGTNIAIFPNNIFAKYVRIYFTGSYTTTVYEFIPARQLIAEMAAISNLATLSATFGAVGGYANFDSTFAALDDKLSDIENGATRNAYRSDWDIGTAYVVGDLVIDDDNGWICILAHTGHAPPTYPVTSNDWWSIYTIKGEDGVAGASGSNTATVFLYQRKSTTPSVPSVTTTYTFATGILADQDNDWVQGVPATDGNALWITTAVAVATGTTDTILTGEWATPVKLAEDGADGSSGDDGYNSATIFLHQRKSTVPAVTDIADPITYTFSTFGISGSLGAWTVAVPSGTDPLYVIGATAVSTTSTDTIARAEWSTPVVLAQDGVDGLSSYVHYAYATAADGSSGFSLTYTGSETYSGWLVDNTEADSEDYTDYAWSLFAGSDGADGADGTDGSAGDPGPAVVLTSSRAVSFTSTDGTLDGSQDSIIFTATTQGLTSPTYSWSQVGCQNTPTASSTSTYEVTAANFGTSKSAIVTCEVDGTYVNKTTIVRLELSTAEAGATDNSDLATGYTTIVGDVISVYSDTVTIASGINDRIDWKEDSTTYYASLTLSTTYTPTTLAAHIQAIMRAEGDSNTTVTYSAVTTKVTIANSTLTTFELLWNTGTYEARSCGATIGFDTSADDTGALTYDSDRGCGLRVLIGDLS